MITVIAEIKVKPGRRDSVMEKIIALLPDVQAEKGCHRYEPYVDFNGQIPWRKTVPDSIFMLEDWESLAHLEAHQQAEHIDKQSQNIKPDVVEVEIHISEKA